MGLGAGFGGGGGATGDTQGASWSWLIPRATEAFISSVESQKGAIADQRCSIENQKGAIAIDFVQR